MCVKNDINETKLEKLMDELKLAIKYGVPTPETSRKLDWKGETLFYWAYVFEELMLINSVDYDFISESDVSGLLPFHEILPAPQVHEILPYLEADGNADFLIDGDTLWYDCNDDEAKEKYGEIQAFIYDNHIVEACAEIYIELRNKKLLES